jgi:hypothetical protein
MEISAFLDIVLYDTHYLLKFFYSQENLPGDITRKQENLPGDIRISGSMRFFDQLSSI